jgi:hypothetical protein
MGLYDQKNGPLKLRPDKKFIIIGVAAFVIVIILAILIFSVNWSGIFSGSNLSIKFSKNPYVLSKDTDLKILVTVKNDSEVDAIDSKITIIPVEDIFFITCSASAIENNSVVIPIMSIDSSRTVNCDVKVSPTINKAEILTGTYNFDITYILNGTRFEKRATLTVK